MGETPMPREQKMSAPKDLRYLQTHEWHRLEGDTVTIGITQFAADELTDITYVSLPKVGDKVAANGRFGEIESVKATSDLYSGVAGTITAVNNELGNEPGLVNRDPYQGGWMIKLKVTSPDDVNKLLSVDEYLQKTGH
jgi:glycine cleavage system H protein